GKAQYVTGLSVADGIVPRLPRRMKKRFRLELYYAEKYGICDHLDRIRCRNFEVRVKRIDGLIAFAYGVEPNWASSMNIKWEKALRGSEWEYLPSARRVRKAQRSMVQDHFASLTELPDLED